MSSSERDLNRQNGASKRRRLALLRRVRALLPTNSSTAAVNDPFTNGNNIENAAVLVFPIDHDHHGREQVYSERCTFELASPPQDADDWISKKKNNRADEGFGVFLQNCALCKKKFAKVTYVHFACRDDQIALDEFDERVEGEFVNLKLWENRIRVLAPPPINRT
ncbi:hypothetical protein L484_002587 [Morus notabilis]|uniref:Uncharacterized protein n=1 Tax=Morus notabilis TaxID=981085 RepID=W9SA07_9ROSA|nr:hypothetical protein L484_002587 [Morus notabilis]